MPTRPGAQAKPGAHRNSRASVLQALTWFALSYGVAVVGYLATNAIASRWLGPAEYGYFVIAVTTSAVLAQLGLLGAHRAGLREAARMDQADDEAMLDLRRGVRGVLVVSLPLVGLAGAVATYLLVDAPRDVRLTLAVAFGVLVLLGGHQKLWANYLRGFGDVRTASLIEGRSGGAIVALVQAGLVWVVWKVAPETGFAGVMVALTVGFALPIFWAARRVMRRWRHLRLSHRDLLRGLRLVLRRDWRFAVNQFASYLNGTVEIWIAGVLLASTAVSDFGAASRLALLLVIPLTSIQVVFAPVTSRLVASGDKKRLERLLRTGATVAALVTAGLWAPMLVVPDGVLRLVFGPGFGDAAPILLLLTLGTVANVGTGLCGIALTMSQHEGVVTAVQVASMVVRVVAGVLAAIWFGVYGLAAVAAVVTILTYLVLWWQAHRRLGLWTHPTLRPSLAVTRSTLG